MQGLVCSDNRNFYFFQLYDLHIGTTGEQSNSDDGCLVEENKCGLNSVNGPVCGENSKCEVSLKEDSVRCTCLPSYRGPKCSIRKYRGQTIQYLSTGGVSILCVSVGTLY